MTNLLQTGDVFKLPFKKRISAVVEDFYFRDNHFDTKSKSVHSINVGTEYSHVINPHTVLIDLKDFLKKKFGISFDLVNDEEIVETVDAFRENSRFLVSNKDEFLVIKTALTGGNQRDNYPDGHHVTAYRLNKGKFDEDGLKISFYQSGCFCDLVENIQPIATMKQILVWQ